MELKQIDPILKRINILFYVFVGLFVVGFIYGVISGVVIGMKMAKSADIAAISVENLSYFQLGVKMSISLGMVVAGVMSMVMFAMLLISIGRSIARKNIFDPRTIRLIDRYAIFQGASLLLVFISSLMMPNNDSMDMMKVYQYSSIISGVSSLVMLLILGQVLKIGMVLRQEQELTI